MTQIRTNKKSSTSANGGGACVWPMLWQIRIIDSEQYIKNIHLKTLQSNQKQADTVGKKILRRRASSE